jgi:hypothetical protein
MYPLSSTRLKVTSSFPIFDVLFNINTTSLRLPNGVCITHVLVTVSAFPIATFPFTAKQKTVEARLWTGGSIISSSKGDHPQRISNQVEMQTKAFLTDWNLDNKAGR